LQNQNILKWVFWNFEVTPMKRDSRNLTVQELCAQRAAELMAETQANQQRNEILCHWPEALRAIPTQVIRSALFGVVEKGSARRYNEQTLIPQGGFRSGAGGIESQHQAEEENGENSHD